MASEENINSKSESQANSTNGSFLKRFFGRKQSTEGLNDASDMQTFGSFEVGEYQNGMPVIKGDNFEEYMRDYYDYENFTNAPVDNNSAIEIISPSKIEGIHLGKREAEDSSIFWSQHENEGTAQSFQDIAAHIPEVKSQLGLGKSLDEIREDPALEKCVSIYFEPVNIPKVVKCNGYYEFQENGRHRILAARELGYEIPVKITAKRIRK